jgi:dynein heavy chain
MSAKLEEIFNCFINNKVPPSWMDNTLGFPSLKPLDSWVNDLVARLDFMGSWVREGPPKTFWVSCFFFPQGFMTATMQTYARATGKPIDTLGFVTHVSEIMAEEVEEEPETGVNIHGLYMQGAKWDYKSKSV